MWSPARDGAGLGPHDADQEGHLPALPRTGRAPGDRRGPRLQHALHPALLAVSARGHRRALVARRGVEATRNRLRQALSSLRHDLKPGGTLEGSVLLADRNDVRLDPAAV